jgi:hypothetical protein
VDGGEATEGGRGFSELSEVPGKTPVSSEPPKDALGHLVFRFIQMVHFPVFVRARTCSDLLRAAHIPPEP